VVDFHDWEGCILLDNIGTKSMPNVLSLKVFRKPPMGSGITGTAAGVWRERTVARFICTV
jgi:hypothetical protein